MSNNGGASRTKSSAKGSRKGNRKGTSNGEESPNSSLNNQSSPLNSQGTHSNTPSTSQRSTRSQTGNSPSQSSPSQSTTRQSPSRRKRQKISLRELQTLENSQVDLSHHRKPIEPQSPQAEPDEDFVSRDETVEEVVAKVVKVLLMKASTDKSIRRKTIMEVCGKMKYVDVYNSANRQLKAVFGMQLVTGGKNNDKVYVVDNLTTKEKTVLHKLYRDTEQVQSNNKRRPGDKEYFIAKYSRDKLPGDNFELVKTGVLALLLTLIIVDENYCNKAKMISELNMFGISGDLNSINSNLNGNFETLLSEFERKEYISKQIVRSDLSNNKVEDDSIFYSIGDKALVEYRPIAFYNLVKEMYGEDFGPNIKSKIKTTLEEAFKISLDGLGDGLGDDDLEVGGGAETNGVNGDNNGGEGVDDGRDGDDGDDDGDDEVNGNQDYTPMKNER